LLTVLTHELGHILGLEDNAEADSVTGTVMADALPLGVRRIHLDGLVAESILSSTHPLAAPPEDWRAQGLTPDAGVPLTRTDRLGTGSPPARAGSIPARGDKVPWTAELLLA